MKKAFTLVEMLIVVVVIVTLMTMTFRLSSIGSDQSKRNTTISRMQRLENCLSGYYAAYGSYPPVAIHGSHNINLEVNDHGLQRNRERSLAWSWTAIGSKDEAEDWRQVKAACRAQPVDCRYPYPSSSVYNDLVKAVSDALRKKAQTGKGMTDAQKKVLAAPFDNGVTDNIGRYRNTDSTDWRDIQLFKFGLMSYLLPRYMIMMASNEKLYDGNFAQWNDNNALPCNPLTGFEYSDWSTVRDRSISTRPDENAEVANIPSQAVTARWLPNLAGIVCCNHDYKLYGVSIRGDQGASELQVDNYDIEVFSPDGADSDSTGQQYVLDSCTVLDGWWHEFYYYSPAPYQTYTLWSGGPNNRTFPPWISRKSLDSKANKCVGLWVEDDIVRMSN